MKQFLLAVILLLLCEIVSGQSNFDTASSSSSVESSSSSSSTSSSSSSSVSASKTTTANPSPTTTEADCIDDDHTLPDLLPNMTLKAGAYCDLGCSSMEFCEARCWNGKGEFCYCAKCYENSLYRKQCEYLKSKSESYYDSDSQICVCDYADKDDSRPQCYTIVTWTGVYNQAVTYAVPVSFWALVAGAVYYFCKRRQVNREYRELRNETIPLTNQRR